MNEFSKSDILKWLQSNGMHQAVEQFNAGIEQIESLPSSSNPQSLIVNCRDPQAWIGAAFAGLSSGVCTCFIGPGLPSEQKMQILDHLPGRRLVFDGDWLVMDENCEIPSLFAEQLCAKLLISTGGSSGSTKFAIHNVETLTVAVRAVAEHFRGSSGGNLVFNYCHDLPLHHVSGWMQAVRAFLTGGKYFLGEGSRSDWMQLESGRFLSLVPTQLKKMISDPEGLKVLRAADTIVVGGGPCPVSLLKDCLSREISPWVTYGMTETLGMIAGKQILCIEDLEKAADLFPHAKVGIVDEKGNELGVGQRGEIVVESPALCRRYFAPNSEGVQINLNDVLDALHTRDLGSKDRSGKLHVWGRMDQLIITGGEKVNPREVEAAITGYEKIKDAYVGSLPDEQWGQRVFCLYVAEQAMTVVQEEIEIFLRQHLEPFKIPKSWSEVDALPYDDKGKLPAHRIEDLIREVFA